MTISKELLDELLKGCERPEDLLGDTGLMKDLRIKLMERMLGAELTAHLGYEEGKDAPPGQANRRNGTASSARGNGLPRRWLHGLATTFVQSDPERVWSRTHSTPCLVSDLKRDERFQSVARSLVTRRIWAISSPSLGALDRFLPILRQTTAATEPCESALHDPSAWQHLEALDGVGALADLQRPASSVQRPGLTRAPRSFGPA